jgi:hypothetical protein
LLSLSCARFETAITSSIAHTSTHRRPIFSIVAP